MLNEFQRTSIYGNGVVYSALTAAEMKMYHKVQKPGLG